MENVIQELTHTAFAGREGQAFQICPEGVDALHGVLLEATLLRAQPGQRRQPFSLVFRGPLTPWLPQRIYAMQHEELGTLEMFLVPIGPDSEGMRYQAIFN